MTTGVGACVESCTSSSDCISGKSCCSNGCGHTCQPTCPSLENCTLGSCPLRASDVTGCLECACGECVTPGIACVGQHKIIEHTLPNGCKEFTCEDPSNGSPACTYVQHGSIFVFSFIFYLFTGLS